MDADNVGAPVTKQQWDYIHKMGDALRQSFENVSAVFAPSCISHSVLTKKDWQNVKIDDISIAEALHCWEHKNARRRMRKLKSEMIADQPKAVGKRGRKRNNARVENVLVSNSTNSSVSDGEETNKKKRRKHRKNRKGRKRKGK